MEAIFNGIFDGELAQTITVGDFLLCLGVSLVLGLLMAAVYTWKNRHSHSFVITLALLPAVVCVVIMMVNGNIGAGVAVAGDVLLSVTANGQTIEITHQYHVIDLMLAVREGDVVSFVLLRDGQETTVDITITADCLTAY